MPLESMPVEENTVNEVDQSTPEDAPTTSTSGKNKKVYFETKSLAEVYAQQGHISMALEIYRRIQKRETSNHVIADRIAELEARLGSKRFIKHKSDMPNQGDSST
jgi:hypothetical protein